MGQIPPAWKAPRSHMHVFRRSYTPRSRECGAAESPPIFSCGLRLPRMNPRPPLSGWEQKVTESHVSWRQTQTENERTGERKRKHGILGGSAIQVLSEKLHSNLVKEWKGSVVSCGVTFPVVWTAWSSSSSRDQLGNKGQHKSESVLSFGQQCGF